MTGNDGSDDQQSGRLSRRATVLLGGGAVVGTVGGVGALASGALGDLLGGASNTNDGSVLSVGSTQIATGETGTVPVTLESAPDGMTGFKLTVAVDTAVATITDATIADEISALTTVTVNEDGSAVTLKAAGRVEAGATDVQLGTVTVQGAEAGSTPLELTVELFDDADGNAQSPETIDGELTVE